jgi:pyrimidine oxygenase
MQIVAAMLDEAAKEPIKGVMLTFDDFRKGVEIFGTKIQPIDEMPLEYLERISSIA